MADARNAETALLQRMLKAVTYGGEKPGSIEINALKTLRTAGLEQLDRALAEIQSPLASGAAPSA